MSGQTSTGGEETAESEVHVRFDAGTLEVRGLPERERMLRRWCAWDPRSRSHRGDALHYAPVVLALREAGVPHRDDARAYERLDLSPRVRREPRPYQKEALEAWLAANGRGLVVLPTGAGKSHVAVMAMAARPRPALVVAPTLDLVRQWYDLLRTSFGVEVGVVGGGEHTVQDLTVTTYDSAWLHMQHFGNRFGLVVFDEAHHLPSESYASAARMCLAPFRLGLTATPERADGREALLEELVGPLVIRRDIGELSGDFLAPYETVRVAVELDPEERAAYETARARYRAFLRRYGVRLGGPQGWSRFVRESAVRPDGPEAMAAYQTQRRIAFGARAKLDYLEMLLHRHRGERLLVFTQDNPTAYAISHRFLLPAITHQTRVRERSDILSGFAEGRYRAVVTSRVLNEGVDVPEASVAVVVSGTGSVREHVQRLGRILRKREGKRALLYELVTLATTEAHTSERRRAHEAYGGPRR